MKDDAGHKRLDDEAGRIRALNLMNAQSIGAEATFDYITRLACLSLDMPTAAVTLLDADTQHLRATQGINVSSCARSDSVCDYTIRTYEPMVVEDMTEDPRFSDIPLVTGPPFLRSYAGVPLTTEDGYNLGALCVLGTSPRSFEPKEIEILEQLAELVMDQLILRSQANTDFLTGARTRQYFLDALDNDLRRHGTPSVLMMDIDHFKTINDTHGHPIGDKVLQEFAGLVLEHSRKHDVVGRFGGEEFAVLLSDTRPEDAQKWAERIREKVAKTLFAAPTDVPLTVSIGVVSADDRTVDRSEWLLSAADIALYRAKKSGRNRVVSL